MSFFSRKGVYDLNVQCIVDHKKKSMMGSTFPQVGLTTQAHLYQKLTGVRDSLHNLELYILRDSVYAVGYFLRPYSSPNPRISKYDFSLFTLVHVSLLNVKLVRLIYGVFLKRLKCSLDHTIIIIEGTMHLHNFLVDYTESVLLQ